MKMLKFVCLLVAVLLNLSYAQTTYYFSSSLGNDSNNGLSSSAPKQSLASLQSLLRSAQPGDKLLLMRGDTWTQRAGTYGIDLSYLHGVAGNEITIGAYGNGNRPVSNLLTNGGISFDDDILYFKSGTSEASYYVIVRDLYLTTSASSYVDKPLYGIGVNTYGSEASAPHHLYFKNIVVDNMREGIWMRYPAQYIYFDSCEVKNTLGSSGTTSSGEGEGIYTDINHLYITNSYIHYNGYPTGRSRTPNVFR